MKKAIVTVGLGFGDEGKGATVDYLVRSHSAGLVVRYCGGAQAGHNVQLPGGRRHTFSQFGAGTLAGAQTFLGPRMIVHPLTMVPEAEHLNELGIDDPWSTLTVHPDCLLTTSYHVWMNRLRERSRGDDRHGSCGLGIGEARHYWLRHSSDAVMAQDLSDRQVLINKLMLLRERFLIEMQKLPRRCSALAAALHASRPGQEADRMRSAAEHLQISRHLPESETVVFEGAQGVLLDEWHGFHPYTTWSTVTPRHALEMLDDYPEAEQTVIGIIRAYATRHGAGPMPTYCRRMSAEMMDQGNPANDWQGAIRMGPLDLVLTEYASRIAKIDSLFVNGLDQLPVNPRIATHYQSIERLEIPDGLDEQAELTRLLERAEPIYQATDEQGIIAALDRLAPVAGTGHGPSCRDRHGLYLAER